MYEVLDLYSSWSVVMAPLLQVASLDTPAGLDGQSSVIPQALIGDVITLHGSL
jgi:hypothetical protein